MIINGEGGRATPGCTVHVGTLSEKTGTQSKVNGAACLGQTVCWVIAALLTSWSPASGPQAWSWAAAAGEAEGPWWAEAPGPRGCHGVSSCASCVFCASACEYCAGQGFHRLQWETTDESHDRLLSDRSWLGNLLNDLFNISRSIFITCPCWMCSEM